MAPAIELLATHGYTPHVYEAGDLRPYSGEDVLNVVFVSG